MRSVLVQRGAHERLKLSWTRILISDQESGVRVRVILVDEIAVETANLVSDSIFEDRTCRKIFTWSATTDTSDVRDADWSRTIAHRANQRRTSSHMTFTCPPGRDRYGDRV